MLLNAARSALERLTSFFPRQDWPRPQYLPLLGDPTFLFILTLPHSGSTALAHVLNTAHRSMLLEERGEGQWLVPGMYRARRWNPEKIVDWESVKSVWHARIQFIESLVGRREIVIEKSPPNIVRLEQLLANFPKHRLVVFNRNPFAFCSSMLHRYHRTASKQKRAQVLRKHAETWLLNSKRLIKHSSTRLVLSFTYEQFCLNPNHCVRILLGAIPELEGISAIEKVRVKDYAPQVISNQNVRQIGLLANSEKDLIAEVIEPHKETLNAFGYSSDWASITTSSG